MLHTKAVKTSVYVYASMEERKVRNGGREINLHEEKTSCIYPVQSSAGIICSMINDYMHESHSNSLL